MKTAVRKTLPIVPKTTVLPTPITTLNGFWRTFTQTTPLTSKPPFRARCLSAYLPRLRQCYFGNFGQFPRYFNEKNTYIFSLLRSSCRRWRPSTEIELFHREQTEKDIVLFAAKKGKTADSTRNGILLQPTIYNAWEPLRFTLSPKSEQRPKTARVCSKLLVMSYSVLISV